MRSRFFELFSLVLTTKSLRGSKIKNILSYKGIKMGNEKLTEKLSKIKDYWDQWMTEWYLNFIKEGISIDNQKIKKEWHVPINHLGNVTNNVYYPAYKYFPEPYWGNIHTNTLEGIFLNINPGGGGENQLYGVEDIDIESEIHEMKERFKDDNEYKYSKIVADFSQDLKYDTTKWMLNKRIKWLNDIDKKERKTLENHLFFDLVPWHTPSKQDIQDYCIEHSNQIIEKVLKPISSLGEEIKGTFNKKIIVRGSTILDLFNKKEFANLLELTSIKQYLIVDKNEPLFKMSSLLTTFKLKELPSTFLVFSGGSSMILPNPDYLIFDIYKNNEENTSTTLREYLKFESTDSNTSETKEV